MRRKLTELSVSRITDPGIVWDTLLPAFGIRVGALDEDVDRGGAAAR